jgi:hypothetical protein
VARNVIKIASGEGPFSVPSTDELFCGTEGTDGSKVEGRDGYCVDMGSSRLHLENILGIASDSINIPTCSTEPPLIGEEVSVFGSECGEAGGFAEELGEVIERDGTAADLERFSVTVWLDGRCYAKRISISTPVARPRSSLWKLVVPRRRYESTVLRNTL